MSNMSYCRFHNTLLSLKDCREHMEDEDLSPAENQEREKLIKVCCVIAEGWGGMIPEDDEE